MKFSKKDIKQIESKGLSQEEVLKQIDLFKTGIPFTNISEAATIGSGIIALNDESINEFVELFESEKDNKSLLKFVPASGAATKYASIGASGATNLVLVPNGGNVGINTTSPSQKLQINLRG